MKNKILSFLYTALVFLLILTLSIGLPIYIRPFYYAHINAMDLPEISGHSYEDIKSAYDEVLSFLTLPGGEFSAGVMRFSPEGKAHFEDCKGLFMLNGTVLLISAMCVLILMIYRRKNKIRFAFGRLPASSLSAIFAIAIPTIAGSLAATNVDKAFVIFHKIFFPGKDNWIFDPRTDEIINVLPQDFFLNCAILIGAGLLFISAAVIVFNLVKAKKETFYEKH